MTPCKAALGAETRFVKLVVHEHEAGVTQSTRSDTGLEVVTVDELIVGVSGGERFIVEIESKGLGKDFFASNTRWIERALCIYIEPHDRMHPSQGTPRLSTRVIIGDRLRVRVVGENLASARAEGLLM